MSGTKKTSMTVDSKRRRLESESEIDHILAECDKDTRVHITNETTLKRHLKELNRKIRENGELRAKCPDEPSKFITSECDLSEELEFFKALATLPELLPLFEKSALDFLSLLSHPNPDLAMLTISVLSEITDSDVISALDKIGFDSGQGALGTAFINHLLDEYDVYSPLGDNLNRLNEFSVVEDADDDEMDEFKAISNILNCVSNFSEVSPEKSDSDLLSSKVILIWILKRVRGDEAEGTTQFVDYNRQYCAEIIASLCQRNENARVIVAADLKGMNCVLEAMAQFRKKTDFTVHEEEFIMNLRDILICMLLEKSNKDLFFKLEGVALMSRLLRTDLKVFRAVALGILSIAVADHPKNCAQLFEQGLGGIFSMLKRSGRKRGSEKDLVAIEEVTNIMKSLAELADGTNQSRLIAKLFENDAAKLKRLFELHLEFYQRLNDEYASQENWDMTVYTNTEGLSDINIEAHRLDEYEDKCEAGLISLQNIDLLLLTLCRYGNDIVTMQIHAYLDQYLAHDIKLILIWANVIREYCLLSPLSESKREDISTSLTQQLQRHSDLLEGITLLTEEAARKSEERRQKIAENMKQEEDEARRLRNRDRKQREKIKKYDRELERREQLEEYRYARKTGTLW